MEIYESSKLKKYIDQSKMIIVNEDLHIRLSDELLEKYNKGCYDKRISDHLNIIEQIKGLNIKYPANAKPIFYMYIVNDDNFRSLLDFPSYLVGKGGGRPVKTFDLDSFNDAYGVSNNVLVSNVEMSIMEQVSTIHEFVHLVHSMFFSNTRFIAEGFSEAIPLYIMNYESKLDDYIETLKNLEEDQILSAQELIYITEHKNFNIGSTNPEMSLRYSYSYISAYLFVRGCLEKIEEKFNLNKNEAVQKFLEIVKQSKYIDKWLVYDIANNIGINPEELYSSKEMQINIIKNIT